MIYEPKLILKPNLKTKFVDYINIFLNTITQLPQQEIERARTAIEDKIISINSDNIHVLTPEFAPPLKKTLSAMTLNLLLNLLAGGKDVVDVVLVFIKIIDLVGRIDEGIDKQTIDSDLLSIQSIMPRVDLSLKFLDPSIIDPVARIFSLVKNYSKGNGMQLLIKILERAIESRKKQFENLDNIP